MHPILESRSTFDFSEAACSLETQFSSHSYKYYHHLPIQPQSSGKVEFAISEEWKCDDEDDIESPTISSADEYTSDCQSEGEYSGSDDSEGEPEYKYPSEPEFESESSTTLMDILQSIEDMTEDILFNQHGYKKIDIISNTKQGKSFKAQILDNTVTEPKPEQFVAIKQCEKAIFKQKIAIQDGMSFFVAKDITKEAKILKYLTVDNCPLGNYIIKYIDFFESDDAYYLVMEYCESELNLKEFIDISWFYLKNEKMKMANYKKFIKCIYWQLAVTMRWLHNDMNCCHLDLCLENIMLTNCDFIRDEDGLLTINPDISIRLADFGVSEVFKSQDAFICHKTQLSIENQALLSPEILKGGSYNAKQADIWSLGIILFECITGKQLYSAGDMFTYDIDNSEINQCKNGYWAVHNGKLIEYLVSNDLLKHFKADSVSLLSHLLDTDALSRYDTNDIIQDKWFSLYHKTYNQRIMKKSRFQKQALMKQSGKMAAFPYYDPETAKKEHGHIILE